MKAGYGGGMPHAVEYVWAGPTAHKTFGGIISDKLALIGGVLLTASMLPNIRSATHLADRTMHRHSCG